MKRNPKMIVGVIGIAVLLAGLIILLTQLIPMAGEVQREMSLTPTPLPPVPGNVMAVTPDPSEPTPVPSLRKGSKGAEVTKLQTRLKELGYYQGEIDGQFGSGTEIAVIAFQRANELEPDGYAGDETRKALYSDSAVPASGTGN